MDKKRKKLINTLRWTARIWSILSIGFFAVMLMGYAIYPDEGTEAVTLVEGIAFLFFPLGLVLGMLVSWKKELLGSIVTIGSLLMFYALILVPRSAYRMIPTTLILAAPGFVFLATSLLERKVVTKEQSS